MVVDGIKLTFYREAEYNKALDLIDIIFPAGIEDFIEAKQVKGCDGRVHWEIIIDDTNKPEDIMMFLQQMA